MLDYENQMLLDLLHEDGLLISARGLGMERILNGLLRSYSDPGNLVIIIGASSQDAEYVICQLENSGVSPLPKYVTAECAIADRAQMYLNGGCLFVTSRILVVDFLTGRAPIDLVTGIIVWQAHQVMESCQEAFILRLYRQKNKKGFIKAISNSPLSFTCGFCKVERVMKNLFVKKLYLWPRFHLNISTCFDANKPEVIELHISMTNSMKEIQMALLDLITSTLQELKLSNRAINTDEFSTENAISRSFDKMVRLQLDHVWHQLSTRTKQLIADLKVLRTVLNYLSQYDCVTFYNLIRSLWSTEKALKSAGWMFLPAAESLDLNAKLRVFGEKSFKSPVKKQKTEKEKGEQVINPEVNPKWLAVSEALDEICKETEERKGCKAEKCLIVAHDERTCQQLREYLCYGGKKMLERTFYRSLGPRLNLDIPPHVYDEPAPKTEPKLAKGKGGGGKVKGRSVNKDDDSAEITLTQINKKYDFIGKDDIEDGKKNEECQKSDAEEEISKRLFDNLLILIHPLKGSSSPFSLTNILNDVLPKYIIMYDSDLRFVRQIEVWQANNTLFMARVYFLIYKGTIDEQIYLTSIKREKDAFEYLIKEKALLVMPEYADGRTDDHPDLVRDSGEEQVTGNDATRKAGLVAEVETQMIVVDMREFRSELPSLVHKRGIEIEPATIEVGDYILTPDVCVERKSVSDLIGSLNSGRLYTQAQAMTRHYKKPILLIEFDQNKPFYLQSHLVISNDGSSSSKDVLAKLQLLTLHFPMLRIIWCPSPYATAELFQLLKKDKKQPNVAEAQAVTSEAKAEYDTDKYNPQIKDFLFHLPGITNKNIHLILRSSTSLKDLLTKTEDELSTILTNSKQAKQLYDALHKEILAVEDVPEKKGFRNRERTKFGKKIVSKIR